MFIFQMQDQGPRLRPLGSDGPHREELDVGRHRGHHWIPRRRVRRN